MEAWNAGILELHPVAEYDVTRRASAHEFSVDETVGDHFAEYLVAQADSHIAFQKKWIIQMFDDEIHQLGIGFDEVYANIDAVVVTVDIAAAQECIGLVMGDE